MTHVSNPDGESAPPPHYHQKIHHHEDVAEMYSQRGWGWQAHGKSLDDFLLSCDRDQLIISLLVMIYRESKRIRNAVEPKDPFHPDVVDKKNESGMPCAQPGCFY